MRGPAHRRLLSASGLARSPVLNQVGPREAAARAVPASLYDYSLPEGRIATEPVSPRDASRLLIHDLTASNTWTPIRHRFRDLPDILPSNVTVVMNHSRVIPARIPGAFKTRTGGAAEIFLLQPSDGRDPAAVLAATSPANTPIWDCMVRGRNLRAGEELRVEGPQKLRGVLLDGEEGVATSRTKRIRLDWQPPDLSLADVLSSLGSTPLPPYIRRASSAADVTDYQTVYAKHDGSVAAPTAGLHFTPETMERCFDPPDRQVAWVTLHVGAGTFVPIRAGADAGKHLMHAERVTVSFESLRVVAEAHSKGNPVLLVGTTSTRVIESVYWHGVGLRIGRWTRPSMALGQWDPYSLADELADKKLPLPTVHESFNSVIESAQRQGVEQLEGTTQLMIVPGYRFQVTQALVTNLHQPRSTLLLLVGAMTGSRESLVQLYQCALDEQLRFLSYGDSTLLAPRAFLSRIPLPPGK